VGSNSNSNSNSNSSNRTHVNHNQGEDRADRTPTRLELLLWPPERHQRLGPLRPQAHGALSPPSTSQQRPQQQQQQQLQQQQQGPSTRMMSISGYLNMLTDFTEVPVFLAAIVTCTITTGLIAGIMAIAAFACGMLIGIIQVVADVMWGMIQAVWPDSGRVLKENLPFLMLVQCVVTSSIGLYLARQSYLLHNEWKVPPWVFWVNTCGFFFSLYKARQSRRQEGSALS
jgi:hypothetical protein